MKTHLNAGSMLVILVVVVTMIFILAILAAQAFAQTPTPDPCAGCPDPASFSCQAWPQVCYDCWSNCGSPISTPTPTPTPPPTPTPTPTPLPPNPGPPCTLHAIGPGTVDLVAVWAHEDGDCTRYTYAVLPRDVPAGSYRFDPWAEGVPVGYEWHDVNTGEIIKSCGDTGREYDCLVDDTIFADGFESGTTEKWNGG